MRCPAAEAGRRPSAQVYAGLSSHSSRFSQHLTRDVSGWDIGWQASWNIFDGWLVKGRFVEIDEGNRAQRAALGFGLGATQMVAQVEVTDLASKNPEEPFLIFGTSKEAGMKPGGFNPYVMAAKFHMEKKATAQDIQKTADEIVGEILKSRDQSR